MQFLAKRDKNLKIEAKQMAGSINGSRNEVLKRTKRNKTKQMRTWCSLKELKARKVI